MYSARAEHREGSAVRIVNGLLCLILLFFAALQINDPDALLWFVIYAVAAVWPGIAAIRPSLLAAHRFLRLAGMVAVALCVVGFFANARTIGADWIHVETAREAFGYAISAVSIAVAVYVSRPSDARYAERNA